MRIAIFGDIHANLEALEAVLRDSEKQKVDQFVCLGDVVGYNADPSACIARVRDLYCPVVKGNHDHDASGNNSLEMMNPVAAQALMWTRLQIDLEQKNWLNRLRLVRQVSDFTITHSTLDQPSSYHYVTNRYDAVSNFHYQFTQICFHGHTHIPKVYIKTDKVREVAAEILEIEADSKYFINVGSVGQPRDGDWRASYAIYDEARKLITFRRVEYDIEKTKAKIISAGLPDVLALRLSEGQ